MRESPLGVTQLTVALLALDSEIGEADLNGEADRSQP